MAALGMTVALVAGCAGSGGGKSGKPKPACKPPSPLTVCFASNIQPIFNQSCALGGCHAGVPAAFNLDLSAGKSYRAIVGVPALEQPNLKLVQPGDPVKSYLQQKIDGTFASGALMPQGCPGLPLNGAQCLTADQINAVSQWITECATNPPTCP